MCVVVLLYCLRVVVLCCLIIETRKVVSVVSCGRCDKIIVLLGVTVLLGVVCRVVVVLWTVWYVVGWVVDRVKGWEVRKRFRELYLKQKLLFCDRVLTDAGTLTIQFSVYSSVKTVYQIEPKKIG